MHPRTFLAATALVIAGIASAAAPETDAAPSRHVVVIGIDGVRVDSMLAAETPHLDAAMAAGCYTLTGIASVGQATNSGPSWSSILTGVWSPKHRVLSNAFIAPRYDQFPHFLARVQAAEPEAVVASIVHWAPINEKIVTEASHRLTGIPDAEVATEAARYLTEQGPRALFVHFDDVDGAGHANGFHPGNANYLEVLSRTDGYVGAILEAITTRKAAHPDEQWLALIVTDHGGTEGGRHGGPTPEEVTVPLIMLGDGIVKGALPDPVHNVDVAVTALTWLGIPIDPAWELDGEPRGLASR